MSDDAAFPLPADRLERRMPDAHPLMTEAQAAAEANRCLYCHDAPCIQACPTGIDVPEFIRKIASGNYRSSARTIFESNILGYSCARVCPVEVLCAGACVLNHMDRAPIEIGRLQRFSTEWAFDRGVRFFKAGPPNPRGAESGKLACDGEATTRVGREAANGRKVACVGAGPASLACAAELARLGYAVTIYEGRELPGGLNTTGVAPYKLYAEDSLRELDWILSIGGIELLTGRWIGREAFRELEERYDAIFLGVGLGRDSRLRVPGEDANEGVWGAVALIEALKNKPAAELAWVGALKRAIVVGGGNTSIDVARELRKLGVPGVTLVYRRGEDEMPAYAHEVRAARSEGASFLFHAQPVEVLGARGHVTGLKVVRTRAGARGSDGRPRVEPIPRSEEVLPVELCAVAIGQEMLEELLAGIPGLTLDRGRVITDQASGQTTNPKYFSGGDCANGGKEVVNAAAEGKRAARGIHAWLEKTHGPLVTGHLSLVTGH